MIPQDSRKCLVFTKMLYDPEAQYMPISKLLKKYEALLQYWYVTRANINANFEHRLAVEEMGEVSWDQKRRRS